MAVARAEGRSPDPAMEPERSTPSRSREGIADRARPSPRFPPPSGSSGAHPVRGRGDRERASSPAVFVRWVSVPRHAGQLSRHLAGSPPSQPRPGRWPPGPHRGPWARAPAQAFRAQASMARSVTGSPATPRWRPTRATPIHPSSSRHPVPIRGTRTLRTSRWSVSHSRRSSARAVTATGPRGPGSETCDGPPAAGWHARAAPAGRRAHGRSRRSVLRRRSRWASSRCARPHSEHERASMQAMKTSRSAAGVIIRGGRPGNSASSSTPPAAR
jgi:hypothetical protein